MVISWKCNILQYNEIICINVNNNVNKYNNVNNNVNKCNNVNNNQCNVIYNVRIKQ